MLLCEGLQSLPPLVVSKSATPCNARALGSAIRIEDQKRRVDLQRTFLLHWNTLRRVATRLHDLMIVKPLSTHSELADLDTEVRHYHRRAWCRGVDNQQAIENRRDGQRSLF
jgi:hypothetical protein